MEILSMDTFRDHMAKFSNIHDTQSSELEGAWTYVLYLIFKINCNSEIYEQKSIITLKHIFINTELCTGEYKQIRVYKYSALNKVKRYLKLKLKTRDYYDENKIFTITFFIDDQKRISIFSFDVWATDEEKIKYLEEMQNYLLTLFEKVKKKFDARREKIDKISSINEMLKEVK